MNKQNGPRPADFLAEMDRLRSALLCAERNAAAAVAADKAKSAFLANMSHEMRTPLSVILGFNEFLLDGALSSGDRQEFALTVKRNAQLLLDLVNDVLDLSKVEAGALALDPQDVPIASLLADMARGLAMQARSKGLSFEVRSDAALPAEVHTDPARLRQVFLNVVGNAIKFTQEGFVRVDVRVKPSAPERRLLVFDVHDTGIGLSALECGHIWTPFSQASPSTSRRFGGTGLGLTLARRLAQALGGDVELVQSEPGVGSTFRITVDARFGLGPQPVSQFSEAACADPANAREDVTESERVGAWAQPCLPARPERGSVRKGALTDVSVLLVEDSIDNQELVRRFLELEGASVHVATEGEEGVRLALGGAFDVVLMDIHMPGGLDGIRATQTLRANGYEGLVIALTANAMAGERERNLACGFDEYLTKPIGRTTLIGMLADAVRRLAGPPNEAPKRLWAPLQAQDLPTSPASTPHGP